MIKSVREGVQDASTDIRRWQSDRAAALARGDLALVQQIDGWIREALGLIAGLGGSR